MASPPSPPHSFTPGLRRAVGVLVCGLGNALALNSHPRADESPSAPSPRAPASTARARLSPRAPASPARARPRRAPPTPAARWPSAAAACRDPSPMRPGGCDPGKDLKSLCVLFQLLLCPYFLFINRAIASLLHSACLPGVFFFVSTEHFFW